KERYSNAEVEIPMDNCYYERYILSNSNNLLAIQRAKQETHNLFMYRYVFEFLDAHKIGDEREF
ncbi:hypothetical protein, partial [Streptobacillus moniliformis]|uniref:hypothetical protein n=1 Tax=Streptobacillus moniliformis TaxID=34105 RepID=UPI000ACED53A